jgi:hypothetical protein
MKNPLLKALALCFSFSFLASPAFALTQYVDCLRTESSERVIMSLSGDALSGTFFATSGVNNGEDERTEALALKKIQTTSSHVTFEARDSQSIFTVEFPAELISQSSSAFLMMISSRAIAGEYTSSNEFACFSSLYAH